jgi:hypothetical protein
VCIYLSESILLHIDNVVTALYYIPVLKFAHAVKKKRKQSGPTSFKYMSLYDTRSCFVNKQLHLIYDL